ncbi:CrcB family protein [Streptomyces katsurahamanus]|uniref:Fluoride-specific ion channel FluC n=1 Tax=Streptomyces katsurahamanus TaxID=2577098 RepID=A0ABW9NYR5_9ACTN|nr:CrcB family protein [Streptomyces katsurahamanus]
MDTHLDSVDPATPAHPAEPSGARLWPVLAAVSAGGAAGALARDAISRAWPADPFPWAVLGINASGSALIGVLMVLVSEGDRRAHPLVRPFLGVGVLGGFTTFSAYALDFRELLTRGESWLAPAYAGGTVCACLAAVWAAASLTRAALAGGRR